MLSQSARIRSYRVFQADLEIGGRCASAVRYCESGNSGQGTWITAFLFSYHVDGVNHDLDPTNCTYEDASTFPCAGGVAYLGLFAPQPHGMEHPESPRGTEARNGRRNRHHERFQRRRTWLLLSQEHSTHHLYSVEQQSNSPNSQVITTVPSSTITTSIDGRSTRHRPQPPPPCYFCPGFGNHGRPADHVRLERYS